MIYFGVFGLTTLLIWIGKQWEKAKFEWVFYASAILILSAFAGLRDYTVGTDVNVYGLQVYNEVSTNFDIFHIYQNGKFNVEPGFVMIAYLGKLLFSDPHGMFFIAALIIDTLVFLFIFEHRNEINVSMAWLSFCFIYFSDTLNIMRQSLAVAIVLFAFRFIESKKLVWYLVCIGIAVFFHTSAIIAVALYFVYHYLNDCKGKQLLIRFFICIFLSLVLLFSFQWLFSALIRSNLISGEYSRYESTREISFAFNSILLRLIPIIPIVLFWHNFKKNPNSVFILLMLLLEMIFYNLSSLSETFYRVTLYMGYYRIYAYSILTSDGGLSNRFNKQIIDGFMVLYLCLMFFYQIVLKNGNGVYPYTSNILGIY